LGHGDITTIKNRVTSIKEEELPSVSVIEPLSVSDEVVAMMEWRSYSHISTATVRMKQSFSASEQL
jgi:hypothetical protein